jgi:hypothetical protein
MRFRQYFNGWFYSQEIQLAEQFNYGHREILITANGLSPQTLFLGSLIHGWGVELSVHGAPFIRTQSFKEYPILAWGERSRESLIRAGHSKVYAVGSPWAHMLHALEINPLLPNPYEDDTAKPCRLLFFPTHSVPGSFASHGERIQELADGVDASEITVCLFWLDFIDPKVRQFYESLGCKITCAGYKGASGFETPWAPVGGRVSFLPNIFQMIDNHDIVAVDSVSTPFWYAISLNKKIILTKPEKSLDWWSSGTPSGILDINNREVLSKVSSKLENFPIGRVVIPDEGLIRICLSELGWDQIANLETFLTKKHSSKLIEISSDLTRPIKQFLTTRSLSFD